jgi:hypothetical protein
MMIAKIEKQSVKIFFYQAGGVAHVKEHLPSKCKAMSSNSSTAKTFSFIELCIIVPVFKKTKI